ncbi:MAG: type II toxin-antitoxin system PemK/MazF family toxin [Patescibacteria group bacterium]|nr:type II toxin-antitoxin system PemK/MazF family toxin [Patescibacteria group bacterium]
MSKGTIILTPFPFTDLSGNKVRPALVLHNQKDGEDCIVAFISSIKNKKSIIHDIPVIATKNNGFKINSTIKISKIATLQKTIILGEIGNLESSIMTKVDNALKNIFKI